MKSGVKGVAAAMAAVVVTTGALAQGGGYQAPGPITIYSIGSPAGFYMNWSNFLSNLVPQYMGQPVTAVQNIPQPVDLLDRLSREPTDGTTWGCMSSQYWMRLHLDSPFDWDPADLPVLGGVIAAPEMVFTSAQTGWDDWEDVKEAGRTVRVGALTIPLLISQQMETDDIDFVLVRMNLSEGMQALVAGDIDLFTVAGSTTTFGGVDDGNWKPIVVVSDERSEYMPDTQTHIEAGWPAEWSSTSVVRVCFVPPGTDPEILEPMRAAFYEMMASPEQEEFMISQRSATRAMTWQEVEEHVAGHVAVKSTFPRELQEQYLFD